MKMPAEAQISRSKCFALLGPYGSGNLGDAAIQEGVIAGIVEFCPSAKFVGVSANPEDTQLRHGIESIPLISTVAHHHQPKILTSRTNRRIGAVFNRAVHLLRESKFCLEVMANLRRIDLLVVSGGGQLDDYWGGPWAHPFTLLQWSCLARVTGTPVAWMGIGFDHLKHPLSRLFVRWALQMAAYRSFRDTRTCEFVESLGIQQRNVVGPDLAFSFPVNSIQRNSMSPSAKQSLVVGISPIAAQAWTITEDPIYQAYVSIMAQICCRLIEEGLEVVIFTSQSRMDQPIAKELMQRAKAHRASRGVLRLVTTDGVHEILSELMAMDIVIASRLHSVILASLTRKPVLAVSYSPKVDMVMADLNQSQFCISIDALKEDVLHDKFMRLLEERHAVRDQLDTRITSFRHALRTQYRAISKLVGCF